MEEKMKKTLSFLVVILVFVFAVSCGGGKNDENGPDDTDSVDDTDAADSDTDADTTPENPDSEKPDSGDSESGDDADSGDSESDDDSDSGDSESENDDEIKDVDIIGRYADNWGGSHIISKTAWFDPSKDGDALFHIKTFEKDFIIAQNDENNAWNPEKWSRFDFFGKGDKIYFCQIAFDKETEADALSVTTADKTDLKAGCAGFGWTELIEVVEEGIDKDDEKIVAWATGYKDYTVGANVNENWKTPEKALGKAVGDSYDVVVLGDGGSIVLTFDRPIVDEDGADFAVFENSISDTFLELGTVEVSSDGKNFVSFDNYYLGSEEVTSFGGHDARLIWGFAGKFKQGVGTMFDLAELAEKSEVVDGTVDLKAITHVKIVDVIGDGKQLDSIGDPVYDPYPTEQSAGFDLDAVAVINEMAKKEFEIEITGKYTDGYATHTISNSDWIMGDSVFHFTKYDKENNFMIAYNAGSNQWNPGLWSRFDYTEKDDELYYCQITYDAATAEAAEAVTAADRTDLGAGCNGFYWSKLTEESE